MMASNREASSTKPAMKSKSKSRSPPVPERQSQSAAAAEVELLTAQPRKPRMKWVYNSDHTDPVNFGFMFLVPDDEEDAENTDTPIPPVTSVASTASRRPSVAVVTPPKGLATSSQPPPSSSSVARYLSAIPDADFDEEGSYLSALSYNKAPGGPLNAQQLYSQANTNRSPAALQHDSPEPFGQQASQASSSHHQLAYRPSPPLATAMLPREQLAPDEQLVWQTQLYQEVIPPRWTQIQNDGMSAFEPYVDPASYTPTPILIHQPSSSSKRKHSARSPSPVDAILLNANRPSKSIAKRRRPQDVDVSGSFMSRRPLICSRCHIYQVAHFSAQETDALLNRKHQNRDPGICNLCLQEFNMYTWPSASQTRMENLESLVLFLLPAHMEDSLLSGPSIIPRNRSWRYFDMVTPHLEYDFEALTSRDLWTTTVRQARSTGLWGEDYSSIAEIIRNYQLSLPQPNVSVEAAATCLVAVCDLYNCFVSAPTRPPTCSILEMIANVRNVRITLRNAFQQYELLALSPSQNRERKEWFPTFLSAFLLTMAAITYIDILGACPSPYKEQIWGLDWADRVREMRHGGYGMLIGVLRANTNGVNPLKLDCWEEEEEVSPFIISTPQSYSQSKKSPTGDGRNKSPTDKKGVKGQWGIGSAAERQRLVLLGRQSPQALAGIMQLKKWETRYQQDLKIGEDMYSKELYAQAVMRPVASLWKIFEMKDTS